jgi:tRNA A37 threonylcarbamoyladenosine synthetase subunit TsaC/SUA5/YrdC
MEMAKRCVNDWPELADKLAKAFWPGPLTLVLPRAKEIPDIVTAGGATVGVRWPGHPFIQAVIRECGFPLAAPSANLSNRVSPTNAGHVRGSSADKFPDRGRRPVAGGHRIHRAGFDGFAAAKFCGRDDSRPIAGRRLR